MTLFLGTLLSYYSSASPQKTQILESRHFCDNSARQVESSSKLHAFTLKPMVRAFSGLFERAPIYIRPVASPESIILRALKPDKCIEKKNMLRQTASLALGLIFLFSTVRAGIVPRSELYTSSHIRSNHWVGSVMNPCEAHNNATAPMTSLSIEGREASIRIMTGNMVSILSRIQLDMVCKII